MRSIKEREASAKVGSTFYIVAGRNIQGDYGVRVSCDEAKEMAYDFCPNVRAMKVKVIKVYPKSKARMREIDERGY